MAGRSAGSLRSRLRHGHQVAAAVLPPRLRVVSERAGLLLAIADGRDPGCGNAEAHEVVLCGIGPALAQGKIVLGRAALVAVPFDAEIEIRPTLRRAGE